MKRLVPIVLLLALFGLQSVSAPPAAAQRRRPPRRTVVVVHKGFPLRRPLRPVVVRPVLRPFRVAPRIFLPLATWGGIVAASLPGSALMVWESGETLTREEEWTEFGLNCENTGTKLWLQIVSGNVRFDWAEVVFGNGETQVVEMQEFLREPGYYLLLDFANGREIDHIRMVAKAETPEARIVLKIQK